MTTQKNWPLLDRIPPFHLVTSDLVLEKFLDFAKEKKLELYPAQEEALLEIFTGKNVILNTPTGSGKSLVATGLHFHSLCLGKRSFYTSPIKALVNEKFFALCREFGPEQVGLITGDANVNTKAPIICCTAEILAVEALKNGTEADVQDVVMDEFHYYSDRERGVAWQVPLLTLPRTRFLLMSATMGGTEGFERILTSLNSLPTVTVKSTDRPVPLDFQFSLNPLHETVSSLIQNGRVPIYLVSFTQKECAEEAQNFMSIDICTREEKSKINEALYGFSFTSPYGRELQKFLKHGMGIHHGGLLPKYRVLVEKLAQKGLLKMIFGTDTLGVGVNVPIRTVLFSKLCKYDGQKTILLSVRDFQQISGRAGRKGFDTLGTVVAQAPEHVIENQRNELKAAGDAKKMKKLVKKKPPEKGFIPWSKETFEKMIRSEAEPLTSKFSVSHAMLLHVLSRPNEDGCRAMKRMLRACHETANVKKQLRMQSMQMFRSLADRKIIEFHPLRINVSLQEDFSLNHALSLYLLDTVKLLDPTELDFPLKALSLVESILESPEFILRKQLDRLKGVKIQEMKMAGMEYEERMEELEKLEHPKPEREFIYNTFNEFIEVHPWVGHENIRPKSIAREIYEGFYSFGEYIREYELQRIEGTLLRYLTDVHKTLIQNVPNVDKTEGLLEISIYLESLIRQVDSSLLDEWERMRTGVTGVDESTLASKEQTQAKVDRWNPRTFRIMVRNEIFQFVKALSREEFESAVGLLSIEDNDSRIKEQMESLKTSKREYQASGHTQILTDPKARAPSYFVIAESTRVWKVTQTLTDPDEQNDWILEFEIDIAKSKESLRPITRFVRMGPIVEV